MTEPSPAAPDVDALVERLRARVAERKASGLYPERLQDDLDAHFDRIVAHRPHPYDYAQLDARLAALDEALVLSPARIHYDSTMPGGEQLHRLIAKAVSRQTTGVLEQLQLMGNAIRDAIREIVVVLQHPSAHAHPELLGQLDALLERVSSYERAPSSTAALAQVERRLERVEASVARDGSPPWYDSITFDEVFRGTRAELLERYDDLARGFVGFDPVLDLGCGRGEFLELLKGHGVEASGVDIDASLVDACRRDGLDVHQGDALEWLGSTVDASLGGVAMIQVIEHLRPGERADAVKLAARKLRRGGKLVIETLNPQSLYIFARAFYADPTHTTPVHPAYLGWLVKEAGFGEISIEWRSPPPEHEVLAPIDADSVSDPTLAAAVNANVARLNELLFSSQDYALVATR
ncbi:MAG TPA: class I SAM-dependent methyltransferase [Acidimicrobiales bacterium]